jgi:hypothetical protein
MAMSLPASYDAERTCGPVDEPEEPGTCERCEAETPPGDDLCDTCGCWEREERRRNERAAEVWARWSDEMTQLLGEGA